MLVKTGRRSQTVKSAAGNGLIGEPNVRLSNLGASVLTGGGRRALFLKRSKARNGGACFHASAYTTFAAFCARFSRVL